MAVSFALFGTLVDADLPSAPATAVAAELRARDVSVPPNFEATYRETHVDAPEGAEVPLPAHLSAALAARGAETPNNAARRAVVAAFDPAVRRRDGVEAALAAAREHGPVAVCANCRVPELARRTLIRTGLRGAFDSVVTSATCGWRKPDERAFRTVARRLGVPPAELVHVGDNPATDGGIIDSGGRFVDVRGTPLSSLGSELEVRP
ncbi:HAD family hydrolase [Halobacteriales archaeon QS_1_68_44]|nr:MAG: HAD family hydrolase [Halobacteriales archaeon QS_1_68_44]